MPNQNPEQIARDNIDRQLNACGWIIQSIKQINLNAGIGVAVREYLTDVGPADYVLFVEGKPCGVIEAKREEERHRINIHYNCEIAERLDVAIVCVKTYHVAKLSTILRGSSVLVQGNRRLL